VDTTTLQDLHHITFQGKGWFWGHAVHGQHLFDTLFDISYCTDKELCSTHARAKLVLHGSSSSTLQHNCCSLPSVLFHNSCFENLGVEIWVVWLTVSSMVYLVSGQSISCMVGLSVVWLIPRAAELSLFSNSCTVSLSLMWLTVGMAQLLPQLKQHDPSEPSCLQLWSPVNEGSRLVICPAL